MKKMKKRTKKLKRRKKQCQRMVQSWRMGRFTGGEDAALF